MHRGRRLTSESRLTRAAGVHSKSPYELELGEAMRGLDPRLRTYFSAIPDGMEGYGEGVFTVVGTPRRWLWPMLSILGRQGVLFPGWHTDVPFTVLNEPVVDADGGVAVNARRTFRFPGGERAMVDAITFDGRDLVDHLGTARRYVATLIPHIEDDALTLRSSGIAVRLGRRHVPVPRGMAPRVVLTERFDDVTGRQHVTVTLAAPLVGQLYVYAGSFEYALRSVHAGAQS